MPTISSYVLGLVGDLYQTKSDAKWYEWSQELIMVAGYEHHSCASFGMPQDTPYHIGMALFPAPFVALYLPSIDDVAYQIQGLAGVMFEKIVESSGLTVACS
jgi:hypothetical protein